MHLTLNTLVNNLLSLLSLLSPLSFLSLLFLLSPLSWLCLLSMLFLVGPIIVLVVPVVLVVLVVPVVPVLPPCCPGCPCCHLCPCCSPLSWNKERQILLFCQLYSDQGFMAVIVGRGYADLVTKATRPNASPIPQGVTLRNSRYCCVAWPSAW